MKINTNIEVRGHLGNHNQSMASALRVETSVKTGFPHKAWPSVTGMRKTMDHRVIRILIKGTERVLAFLFGDPTPS